MLWLDLGVLWLTPVPLSTQVTFFGAWLVLDSRRVERGGVDCCPCLCKPRKVEDADCTCCGSSSVRRRSLQRAGLPPLSLTH